MVGKYAGSSRTGLAAVLVGGGVAGICAIYSRIRAMSAAVSGGISPIRGAQSRSTGADRRKPAGRCLSCTGEADVTAGPASDLPVLAWELGHPGGVGVSGADAAGFLRAVFVELLVSGPDGTRVVIGRDELNLLFGDRAEELPWHAFLPRLQVCELLEEAIEHLEMDIWMTDAERANEDLTPGTAGNVSRTYWFASPGEDSDVVFQTLRRADGYNLAGLMFGTWPHGITIPMTARITEARSFSPFGALPLMPVSEAMARLSVLGSGGSAGGNGTRTD